MTSTCSNCDFWPEWECRKLQEFEDFLQNCRADIGSAEIRSSMSRRNNDTYPVTAQEMRAEIIAVIWNHLNSKRCPPDLQLMLLRSIVDEIVCECSNIKANDVVSVAASGDNDDEREREIMYDLSKLQKFAVNKLEKLLTRLMDNAEPNNLQHFLRQCKEKLYSEKNLCDSSSSNNHTKPLLRSMPTTIVPPYLASAVKNKPRKMEDRYCCWPLFSDVYDIKVDNRQYAFYGVFDGHGGSLAAAYASTQLPQLCAARLREKQYTDSSANCVAAALKDAFIQADKQFARKCISSGTTAVCALHCAQRDANDDATTIAAQHQLYIAWVGDSKAMLISRTRHQQFVRRPHKASCPDERRRIEAQDSGAVMLVQGQWRVNGILNVSRSIGDYTVHSVIAEPDVVCVDIAQDDDFLVLATDGLWDYASEEDIVAAIYDGLSKSDKSFEDLPKLLINLAKCGDSQDNITVVVVLLRDAVLIKADYIE